jgi:hypothetical protein
LERWFRELTDKAIRRGVFPSVHDPRRRHRRLPDKHYADHRPFAWTASAESIIVKVERGAPRFKASLRSIVGHCTS